MANTRPPNRRYTAPIVATFVAGPAIKNTSAAPVGKPPATKAAAIGTDAVAHTYSGIEMASAAKADGRMPSEPKPLR